MGTVTNFPNTRPRSQTFDEMLTFLAECLINELPVEERAAAWASFKEMVLNKPDAGTTTED